MKKNNLCIIPARGGSKRIPRKNIRDFFGKPIIAYSIEIALKSNLFDEVIVSTNDEEIAEISKNYGASVPFLRSKKNSSDTASTFDVIEEVINQIKKLNKFYQHCCCIYPCSPFITNEILEKAYDNLINNELDSTFPIIKYGHPIQRAFKIDKKGKLKYIQDKYHLSRSQDLKDSYYDAGQFYWMDILKVLKNQRIVSKNSGGIIIEELNAQDIDNEVDWRLAELKFKLLK